MSGNVIDDRNAIYIREDYKVEPYTQQRLIRSEQTQAKTDEVDAYTAKMIKSEQYAEIGLEKIEWMELGIAAH